MMREERGAVFVSLDVNGRLEWSSMLEAVRLTRHTGYRHGRTPGQDPP
jgi:hypothetical protein